MFQIFGDLDVYNSMINQLVRINYRWDDPILSIFATPTNLRQKWCFRGEKIAHQAEKYFLFTFVPPSAKKTIYTLYINYLHY